MATPSGHMKCHYEVYTKDNSQIASNSEAFKINLTKSYSQNTAHPNLRHVFVLYYQPTTVDGLSVEHMSLTLSYNGAQVESINPITQGRHSLQITTDGGDLATAYLNCDVFTSSGK